MCFFCMARRVHVVDLGRLAAIGYVTYVATDAADATAAADMGSSSGSGQPWRKQWVLT